MRQSKDTEKFVDEVIKELPFSKYTPRFREELLEHLEDSEEELKNQNTNNIPELIMQKTGSKILLVQNFRAFHRKRHTKLWLLELAFYILFSLLIYSIVSLTLNYFESTFVDAEYSISLVSSIITLCATIFFALAVNYIFYNFLSVRLSLHMESDDRKQRLLVILFFLPAISALTNLMSAFGALGQAQLWGILIAPLPFLCAFLPALLNFRLICKDRKGTSLDAMIPYVTCGGFLTLLLLVIALDKIPLSRIPQVLQSLMIVFHGFHFILFFLFDFIIMLPFLSFSPDPMHMVSVNIAIAAICLLSLGSGSILVLRSARKQKDPAKKRWARAIGLMLCAYALFIFLPVKSINAPVLDWKVPMVEVSKQIEKNQFGIFYDFIKFKNDDEGYIYNYDTCGTENGFIAKQSSGEVFTLDTATISSSGEIKAVRDEKQDTREYCPQSTTEEFRFENESLFFFQDGWKCLDKDNNPLSIHKSYGYIQGCTKITYNDREILREPYENSMSTTRSIDMSADGNWALIKMADVYSVDFLYLVDLRGLE